MNWGELHSILDYGFLRRAVLAAILMSLTCGLIAPVVVLRRLSFSTDGLAHSSLGGLAIGVIFVTNGASPSLISYLISFIFTVSVAAGITYLSENNRIDSDTAVGVCYVAAFALGVLVLSLREGYSGHLDQFFFGSLLAVNQIECLLLLILSLISFIFIFWNWLSVGKWTFNEEMAHAEGVPVKKLRYFFMFLVVAVVIVSSRVVGVLLVTSMLIVPGAVGSLASRSMFGITIVSIATALVSSLIGLSISNSYDVPPGPVIVLTGFLIFLGTYLTQYRKKLPL
ncbi:MAG: hypothetical protein CMF71_09635 [Magnetovibrio sp.]|nr:hypothetical protein [Magnetovibrio sp.]|tara:strand:- start:385 stop:1233 length:849 start_codon:yes stop_codon:yes gene_type:complete